MDFKETPASATLYAVLGEALEEIGRQTTIDATEQIRQYILDRWHLFEEYGVTCRADLDAIKVMIRNEPSETNPSWDTDVYLVSSITVSVAGTKLWSEP